MRDVGLQVGRRGCTRVRTTLRDSASARPPGLVTRAFHAEAPNRLWIVDFIYVPTWPGTAFTAFVSDVCSRWIVGSFTVFRMPTELLLDSLEIFLSPRAGDGEDVTGVIQRSDAGVQYASIRYAEPLADAGAISSIGSVGDLSDNAVAESVISSYKNECVKRDGLFHTLDELELATLSRIRWFNPQRLRSSINYLPPVEPEAEHYRQNTARRQAPSGDPALSLAPVRFRWVAQPTSCSERD